MRIWTMMMKMIPTTSLDCMTELLICMGALGQTKLTIEAWGWVIFCPKTNWFFTAFTKRLVTVV